MSFQKAINEVASLLTQGGIPSNHAGDIAARLTNAIASYYDSRQSQGNNSDINSGSSGNAAFRNAFRSSEEYPGGRPGKAGKDGAGAYAWAVGADGKDGETGESGQDGFGQDGQDGFGFGGGGGFTIDISKVSCRDLKKKLADCGIKTGGCDCDSANCNPKCCPGYGGTGMLNGQSLCAVVDAQARMLKEIRERLDKAEERLDKIEKQLEDAVECP
jgi:hypothetical protein